MSMGSETIAGLLCAIAIDIAIAIAIIIIIIITIIIIMTIIIIIIRSMATTTPASGTGSPVGGWSGTVPAIGLGGVQNGLQQIQFLDFITHGVLLKLWPLTTALRGPVTKFATVETFSW